MGAIAGAGLFVAAVGMGSGGGSWDWEAGPGPVAPFSEETTVTRVIDGDTIVVAGDRQVRLIGIDAPAPTDCYGGEATTLLADLLPDGAAVRLEYDEEREDGLGHTLAYVYRSDDGRFVNQALAREGAVRESVGAPNLAHVEDLLIAVAQAQTAGNGLWSACGETPTSAPPPSSPTTVATTTTGPPTTGPPTTGPPTTGPPTTGPPTSGPPTSGPPTTGATTTTANATTTGARPATATTAVLLAATATTPGPACHPSCVGECLLVGSDEYGLDRDGNGIACET